MPKSIIRLAARLVASATTLAIVALSAAAVNAQPPASHNQCFYVRNINGFNAPNDRTLYIRVGVNEVYRLDLMVDCTGMSFRQGLGIRSTPGDPWICSPIQAEIVYREHGIPSRCPVSAIHKLTPDELAALPKRDRP